MIMAWNQLYGAYISYHHDGVYTYNTVIVGTWGKVMAELDNFIKESAEGFIESFSERLNLMDFNDDIEEYDYLDESMWGTDIIQAVIQTEIKKADFQEGLPYQSRRYWQFTDGAFDDVYSEENSWFKILCEGSLPQFVFEWHQLVVNANRSHSTALDLPARQSFNHNDLELAKTVGLCNLELLEKLSPFIDIDMKKHPKAIKGFYELVNDFNEKNQV